MLRVALESLIVLGQICDSYEFVHAYAKVGEMDRLRLVQSIRHSPPKVFEDIKPELTNELIKQIEETIGETKSTRNIEQWAKDIGLYHLYAGAYRLFSQDIHSSPRVFDKFFMTNEENEVIGFEWGPKEDEDLRVELMESARYLIQAMSFMNKLFELNIDTSLKIFDNQYKELDTLANEKS